MLVMWYLWGVKWTPGMGILEVSYGWLDQLSLGGSHHRSDSCFRTNQQLGNDTRKLHPVLRSCSCFALTPGIAILPRHFNQAELLLFILCSLSPPLSCCLPVTSAQAGGVQIPTALIIASSPAICLFPPNTNNV